MVIFPWQETESFFYTLQQLAEHLTYQSFDKHCLNEFINNFQVRKLLPDEKNIAILSSLSLQNYTVGQYAAKICTLAFTKLIGKFNH